MVTTRFDPRFSAPDASATPWSEVDEALSAAEIFWITTVRADGRPHVTPLLAVWDGTALHFATGAGEQKFVNLEGSDRVALTTGSDQWAEGFDVVVEGRAVRVTDDLQRLADAWKARFDWDFTVAGDVFVNEVGGPAHVFAVRPDKVLAWVRAPGRYAQTAYDFDGEGR